MKDIIGDGHIKDVLEVEFWGRIREGRVYRNLLGLDGVVKCVRIASLYREGHGDWLAGTMGKRRGMVQRGRLVGLSGRGGSGWGEWAREIVGERSPVKGRGGIDDGPGRGGRHRMLRGSYHQDEEQSN